MPKARATAASASGTSAAIRQVSDRQADLDKPIKAQPKPNEPTASGLPSQDDPEAIQLLAYQLWIDRGSPHGSPEVDWIEAVRLKRNSKA